MQALLMLARNAGLLQLAKVLSGRRSTVTGLASAASGGVFVPALGELTKALNAMPRSQLVVLLSLAGDMLARYIPYLTREARNRSPEEIGLPTNLAGDVVYTDLRSVLTKANPWAKEAMKIFTPVLGATGYGAPIAGLLNWGVGASEEYAKSGNVTGVGPFRLGDILYSRSSQRIKKEREELKRLTEQMAELERAEVEAERRRQEENQAREFERTLQLAQTQAIVGASMGDTIYDVLYSRKKRQLKAIQEEKEAVASAIAEKKRAMLENARELREREHRAQLQRVLALAQTNAAAQAAAMQSELPSEEGFFEGEEAYFGPTAEEFSMDAACCCNGNKTDSSYVRARPVNSGLARELAVAPDDKPRATIVVPNGDTLSFSDRLSIYTDMADAHGWPYPEEVLADLLINTEPMLEALNLQHFDSCGCCAKDADCACCKKDMQLDAAFASAGNLPRGEFFNSSWVSAKLDDLPEGTYGMINTGRKPFEVTINRNVELPRAQVSFAHEMLHAMDNLLKLGLSHDQVHSAAVLLTSEVLPGLNALTSAANKQ